MGKHDGGQSKTVKTFLNTDKVSAIWEWVGRLKFNSSGMKPQELRTQRFTMKWEPEKDDEDDIDITEDSDATELTTFFRGEKEPRLILRDPGAPTDGPDGTKANKAEH